MLMRFVTASLPSSIADIVTEMSAQKRKQDFQVQGSPDWPEI
jgi:hypothetical protein